MQIRNCLFFRNTRYLLHRSFEGSCGLIFSFLCRVLHIIVCLFVPFLWPLYLLSSGLLSSDLHLLVTLLKSSNFYCINNLNACLLYAKSCLMTICFNLSIAGHQYCCRSYTLFLIEIYVFPHIGHS